MNRHAKLHDKPTQIIPERWLVESKDSKDGFSLNKDLLYFNPFFNTFGNDKRMCPGRKFSELEALVVIAEFAIRYAMSCDLNKSYQSPGFTLELRKGVKPMMMFAHAAGQKKEKEFKSPGPK